MTDSESEDVCPLHMEHAHEFCSAGTCKKCRQERAKEFCKDIGCSGIDPKTCTDNPLDCQIVKKVFK